METLPALLGVALIAGGCAVRSTNLPPDGVPATSDSHGVVTIQHPNAGAPLASAPADTCTGRWVWIFDFTPGLIVGASGTFTQDGEGLTGNAQIGQHATVPIDEGRVEGEIIRFSITMKDDDGVYVQKYTGAREGDKIRGMVENVWTRPDEKPSRVSLPWKAMRVPASDANTDKPHAIEWEKKFEEFLGEDKKQMGPTTFPARDRH